MSSFVISLKFQRLQLDSAEHICRKPLCALRCFILSSLSLQYKWTRDGTDIVRTGLTERLIAKTFFSLHSPVAFAPPFEKWFALSSYFFSCTQVSQDFYWFGTTFIPYNNNTKLYFSSSFPQTEIQAASLNTIYTK